MGSWEYLAVVLLCTRDNEFRHFVNSSYIYCTFAYKRQYILCLMGALGHISLWYTQTWSHISIAMKLAHHLMHTAAQLAYPAPSLPQQQSWKHCARCNTLSDSCLPNIDMDLQTRHTHLLETEWYTCKVLITCHGCSDVIRRSILAMPSVALKYLKYVYLTTPTALRIFGWSILLTADAILIARLSGFMHIPQMHILTAKIQCMCMA